MSDFVELRKAPKRYKLVGCINTLEIRGEPHYIYFTKDFNSDTWLCFDHDKLNKVDGNRVITCGIPIPLF